MNNSKSKRDPSSLIIAGTNYDRRRKVTKQMAIRMKKMIEAGNSVSSIAKIFDVSIDSVKRNTDEKFNKAERARKRELAQRKGYTSNITPEQTAERLAYKKNLIKSRKKIEQWVK